MPSTMLLTRSPWSAFAADEVFVSSASAWEVAIKSSLGKISGKRSVATAAAESGFQELPIGFAHAEQVPRLPSIHRDPFDRIMIAPAQGEGLSVVSGDRALDAYDVPLIVRSVLHQTDGQGRRAQDDHRDERR